MRKASTLAALTLAAVTTSTVPHATAADKDNVVDYAALSSELDCDSGASTVVKSADGSKHAVGCENLYPQDEQEDRDNKYKESNDIPNVNMYNHWSPYEDHTWTCGSSTIRNQQIGYLWYKGTVHASGEPGSGQDCGGSGRVVKASISYQRAGQELSRADAGVGETNTANARDTIVDQSNPTTVFYDFTLE